MTVASFIGEGLAPPASLAGRRVSLQHTVVTFLLIELTLFLLCAIAPSFYLEKFGFLEFTPEQFDAQLTAAGVGAVFYICAARLYPVHAAAHILETKLNLKRLMVVLLLPSPHWWRLRPRRRRHSSIRAFGFSAGR